MAKTQTEEEKKRAEETRKLAAEKQARLKKALVALKVKASEVLSHKEYDDRIVIVTKHGQKLTWIKE